MIDLQISIAWQLRTKITTASQVQIHIFSYSSNLAYGATAYFCTEKNSNLIMVKTKVAPVKPATIPKLELTSVLLAARLTEFLVITNKKDYSVTAELHCTGYKVINHYQCMWLNDC